MPTERLTKRSIDALSAGASAYIMYDDSLTGFGVRVMPSGAKAYVVEYRPGAGGRGVAKRRMTLAAVGTLTPDEARQQARTLLAAARLGQDPAGERAKARQAQTIEQLAERYLKEEVRRTNKASTAELYEIYFRRHINPEIGKLKAIDVKQADIRRVHRKVGEKKNARGAPLHTTANRCLAALSGLFKWAAEERAVSDGHNPVRGLKPYRENKRERFLTLEELQRLGAAIEEAETVGVPWQRPDGKPLSKHAPRPENQRVTIAPHAAAALRLLIFTGARLREILHLRWSEIDFERGLILLPDSKTGAKPIILNAPALALLAGLPRLGVYVVAGTSAGARDEKPRSDLKAPWALVTRRAGLEGLRIHDLRHTFASFGAGHGLGLPIIGKLLGHKQAATTERYAHLDSDPLRIAADRIGATISAAMGGRKNGEVIKLARNGVKT